MGKAWRPDPPWTPFERLPVPDKLILAHGNTGSPIPWGYYENSRYVVLCYQIATTMFVPGMEEGYPDLGPNANRVPMTWLSIKRIDREVVHDWRDLQRIKNEILGTEVEAVELYPAESRLVDTSNQFHLWALPAGLSFPFGYQERLVVQGTGKTAPGKARQRPFAEGAVPDDAISEAEAEELAAKDPTQK